MGEVVRGVNFGSPGAQAPRPEPAKSSEQTKLKLDELSEETLISTAIMREIRLCKANQQIIAGEITLEEFSGALDEAMAISSYLTEQQQTAVYVFAQVVCESKPASSEEGE